MSPFELLKKDHAAVLSVLEKLRVLPEDAPLKRDTFDQLKAHLELHAHLEENFFYPQLKRKEDIQKLVDEAMREHTTVKELLTEMSAMAKSGKQWDEKLDELRRNIEQHVSEEEGDLFVKARDVLSMDEWDDIGTRMEREQSKQLVEK